MEVAGRLSDTFNVTVLLGDVATMDIDVPENVELVLLPALGIDLDSNVIDIGRSQELRERLVTRRDIMLLVF